MKSADQGNIPAIYALGAMYGEGDGVELDLEKAFKYCKTAADLGDENAKFQLGRLYYNGQGVEEDFPMARKLVLEAAEKNESFFYTLAEMCHCASPGFQDFGEAFDYYQKSTDGKDKFAALRGIGLLYEYGDGVEKNYELAMDYLNQSAEGENKAAFYNIALLYYHGRGVNQDFDAAFECFNKVIEDEFDEDITHVFIEKEDEGWISDT
jgi:TPR repeat protein